MPLSEEASTSSLSTLDMMPMSEGATTYPLSMLEIMPSSEGAAESTDNTSSPSRGEIVPPDSSLFTLPILSDEAIKKEHLKQLHREGIHLRPLRLLPIGKVSPYSDEDKYFIKHIEITRAPIMFRQPCPKRPNSESEQRYLKYMHAKTWTQALLFRHDSRRRFMILSTRINYFSKT
jgi:hypothetical protein